MNHLIRHIFVTFFVTVISQTLFARPYFGEEFSLKQPNGTSVQVKIFGNEFYQDVESLDGYTLIRDEVTNEICYAMLSKDGKEYASTGIVYANEETPDAVKSIIKKGIRISSESIKEKQEETKAKLNFGKETKVTLRAARVLPDTVYGIVVLVDFPDTKSSITKEQVWEFCNGDHYKEFGNYQSIKEYFQWISNGKLTYLNYVTDFYTAPQNKNYYDSGDDYKDDLFLPVVETALNEEKSVKLSQLTSMEGRLLAINIFYAGTADAGWAHGLWPHMGWFNFKLNGFSKYTWHTFQMSDLGKELTIGTFIHENGHLVCGWPDFYSYDGHEDNNNHYGLGEGDQTYNPGYPSPWCLDQEGWLNNKIDITNINDGRLITLQHKVGEAAVFYGTKNDAAPSEKYYIEVRKSTDDHKEPYNGIFIWHNNEEGDNTTEGKPEQQDCRPASQYDPCFKTGNKTEFNDDTDPSGIWYNGTRSDIYLWDFSAAGGTMSFRCGQLMENPEIQKSILLDAILNIAYSDTVFSVGGNQPYSYTLTDGDLPDGLTMNAAGYISGIPTKEGDFEFTISSTDADGKTATKTLTISVKNSTPYAGNIVIPGTLQFEDYDNGGDGVAYHDNDLGNSGNVYRDEDVDIYTIDTGGYGVGWTNGGEWLQYSIDVKETGLYNAKIYHASYYSDISASLLIDNENVAYIPSFPSSNSWGNNANSYEITEIENLPLTKGVHKLRFLLESCTGIDLDKMEFVLNNPSQTKEQNAQKQINAYHSNGCFVLDNPSATETHVSVCRADGSLVEHFSTCDSKSTFGQNYPDGIYLIRITTNSSCKIVKLLK